MKKIPERVVHARGSGAHGYFEAYEDMSKYTKAFVFMEETYRHNKPLAFSGEAIELYKMSGINKMKDASELLKKDIFEEHGLFYLENGKAQDLAPKFLKAIAEHRQWEREGEKLR